MKKAMLYRSTRIMYTTTARIKTSTPNRRSACDCIQKIKIIVPGRIVTNPQKKENNEIRISTRKAWRN